MTVTDGGLVAAINGLAGVRLAIVGDVMIDVWWEGVVRRVSPEAPVPVVELASTEVGLGGAANVAVVIGALGGTATVLGVVGDDNSASRLRGLSEAAGLDTHLVDHPGRPTTSKTRIVSGPQQLCRIDEECTDPLDALVADRIRSAVPGVLADVDAVVLSDYGKGVLDDDLVDVVCRAAAERGLPVVADPWGAGADRFGAATLVKPNRLEACTALGVPTVTPAADLAKSLRDRIGGASVLVTDGARGMALATANGVDLLEAVHREVADVTGAGDAVAAVVAAALGRGADFVTAAELGNIAGAAAVSKRGTAPFTVAELHRVAESATSGDA